MQGNQEKVSAGGTVVFLLLLLNAVALEQGLTGNAAWYKLCIVTAPLLLLSLMLRDKPI